MHNAATEVKLGTYQKYLPSSQKNPANIEMSTVVLCIKRKIGEFNATFLMASYSQITLIPII